MGYNDLFTNKVTLKTICLQIIYMCVWVRLYVYKTLTLAMRSFQGRIYNSWFQAVCFAESKIILIFSNQI